MYNSFRMQSVQSPIIPVIGELNRANPGTISLGQGVAYGALQKKTAVEGIGRQVRGLKSILGT